jgi:F0F1-type ATP synthase epsilon subunit
MKCIIRKSDKVIFEDEILDLVCRTSVGELQILNEYAKSFLILVSGIIEVKKVNKMKMEFDHGEGILFTDGKTITVLV